MKDLKIKVNNEAESKEVQELLFELGYMWKSGDKKYLNCGLDVFYILSRGNGEMSYCDVGEVDFISKNSGYSFFKTTTIAELRSMVNPMKEYLNKNTYEYKLAHTKPDGDWVEIPEGAIEARLTPSWLINFINSDSDYMNCVTGGEWVSTHRFKHDEAGHKIIWQRPTQPEALPFIDDNPQSLNEQYAEIEQVRQAIKVKSGSDSDHISDAMSYGFVGGIDATIAERQSTYGNFEDVAFVTENIMSVLGSVRVNGLSELPTTHRMALYMIASKMARIVNGDFNHLDSWHDIGGYAKLIEDLVKENNNG